MKDVTERTLKCKCWSEKPTNLCVFKNLYKFALNPIFDDKLLEMDDMIEDTFSKEEIELLDETIDFFKDYKSYQMMTLFRSTIKCENDIKALFTNLTK